MKINSCPEAVKNDKDGFYRNTFHHVPITKERSPLFPKKRGKVLDKLTTASYY